VPLPLLVVCGATCAVEAEQQQLQLLQQKPWLAGTKATAEALARAKEDSEDDSLCHLFRWTDVMQSLDDKAQASHHQHQSSSTCYQSTSVCALSVVGAAVRTLPRNRSALYLLRDRRYVVHGDILL
jgi:hypothetical protein